MPKKKDKKKEKAPELVLTKDGIWTRADNSKKKGKNGE